MEGTLGYIVKALLLPPGLNFFVIIAGLCLRLWWRGPGTAVATVSFIALWLCSLPIVAGLSIDSLEHYPAFDMNVPHDGETVVVLGGRRNSSSPEYGGDTVGADTLERIRYGARLARELGLSLAVTGGGSKKANAEPLANLMASVLSDEFGQPATWIETASRNTAENAKNLRAMMPHDKIILVTHSLHMRRALDSFEKVGFTVRAAPIDIPVHASAEFRFKLYDWLPSAKALLISRSVMYEQLGSVYYSLRY